MLDLTDNKNIDTYVKAVGHFKDAPEKVQEFHNYIQLHAENYNLPSSPEEIDNIYNDIYKDYLDDDPRNPGSKTGTGTGN
ncbi:MAG: hypothetical protein AAF639_33690 [Chloroflexota bacterium]